VRLCLACGEPSIGSRCRMCARAYSRWRYERRGGPAARSWRNQVLARDGHRCVRCGRPCPHPLAHHEVDHIKPLARYPRLALAVENGRTLCHECHVRIGARG
jgi:5-methylcytosine-specific restriction endonuclease McrA